MIPEERPSVLDPHRFRRDRKGMVKFRINLSPEEADLIEQGAGEVPLPSFIRSAILDRAHANLSRNTD